MIDIIFYPGTHGNYLEFVLNKLLYGDQINMTSPLANELGTSHTQRTNLNYLRNRFFKCSSIYKLIHNDKIIKIDFDYRDLLTVLQLNLKRGEDYNIDVDTLTENTYFKLFNKVGPYGKTGNGPDKIIDSINKYSEIDSYNNVKSIDWPNISTVDDFYKLPQKIIDECKNDFGVAPFILNESHPNCPRHILRDIFKEWFLSDLTPYNLIKEVDKKYPNVKQCYSINLRSFYNTHEFILELKNIENYFNLKFNNYDALSFHQDFIDLVPYQNSIDNCENIINSIATNNNFSINLNVMEEGFVNSVLEKKFNITMPFLQEKYFENMYELRKFLITTGTLI
jgi:hypothetical protein